MFQLTDEREKLIANIAWASGYRDGVAAALASMQQRDITALMATQKKELDAQGASVV